MARGWRHRERPGLPPRKPLMNILTRLVTLSLLAPLAIATHAAEAPVAGPAIVVDCAKPVLPSQREVGEMTGQQLRPGLRHPRPADGRSPPRLSAQGDSAGPPGDGVARARTRPHGRANQRDALSRLQYGPRSQWHSLIEFGHRFESPMIAACRSGLRPRHSGKVSSVGGVAPTYGVTGSRKNSRAVAVVIAAVAAASSPRSRASSSTMCARYFGSLRWCEGFGLTVRGSR
jgi:hypothetical protein